MGRVSDRSGSALLLAAVVSVALLGLGSAFFYVVMGEGRAQFAVDSGSDALMVVEAGISRAVQELRSGKDYDGNGVLGGVSGRFHDALYSVLRTDPGDGTFALTCEAEKNGVRRAAEVRVMASPTPLPVPGSGAQAAVGLLGKLGKKGKIDIHIKDGDEGDGEHGAGWTSSSGSPIAVDGRDASGSVPGVMGIGIEDPETYKKVADRYAHKIWHGRIPPDVFMGAEMFMIHSDRHRGIDVPSSIGPIKNPSLDYMEMSALADRIENFVDTKLIPNPDNFITNRRGSDVKITTAVTWGTPAAPKITYVDPRKLLKIKDGGSVKGAGTLIIQGDFKIEDRGKFEWEGSVIVLGGRDKDSILKNKSGDMKVNGPIIVLGGDERKKRAKLELRDEAGLGGTTEINGPLFVWTGNNSKRTQEKAEFKARHGNFRINGFIGVYGDKTKFDVKLEGRRPGNFILNGGVVVAVPDDGKERHKARVHLHGDEILVQYHKVYVDKAVERLKTLTDKLPEPMASDYQIVSWREVPPSGTALEVNNHPGTYKPQ